MKYSESKWQVSRSRRILKIAYLDGNETHRDRQEENIRVIKFESQIEPVREKHCEIVLGK